MYISLSERALRPPCVILSERCASCVILSEREARVEGSRLFGVRRVAQMVRGLVIFGVYFKVRLWMIAYGAHIGSFCTNNNVTTIATFPHFYF